MSRRFCVLFFLAITFITAVLCFEPLMIIFIRFQIKQQLAADTVEIKHFQITLSTVQLSNILIEKKKTFTVKADSVLVGFRLPDILHKKFESIVIDNASGDYQKAHVEELHLRAHHLEANGQLSIAKVLYDKGLWENIQSPVQMREMGLVLTDLSADFFNGHITGRIQIDIDKEPQYHVQVHFTDLDISRFIHDFDLKEKINMTGMMNGDLKAVGRGAEFSILDGDFKMASPGGELIVKDRRLLENVVEKRYLDTAIETLQDYHYNTGALQVSMEDNNLIADIHLNGRQGKRDFKVVYHPKRD